MNFTLTMTFYGSCQRKEWLTGNLLPKRRNYSNGDYYFSFDTEWKYGLFGHPWRGEFVVIGQELIDMFESNKQYLGII